MSLARSFWRSWTTSRRRATLRCDRQSGSIHSYKMAMAHRDFNHLLACCPLFPQHAVCSEQFSVFAHCGSCTVMGWCSAETQGVSVVAPQTALECLCILNITGPFIVLYPGTYRRQLHQANRAAKYLTCKKSWAVRLQKQQIRSIKSFPLCRLDPWGKNSGESAGLWAELCGRPKGEDSMGAAGPERGAHSGHGVDRRPALHQPAWHPVLRHRCR